MAIKENSLTLHQLAEETAHRRARPKAMSIDDVTSAVDDVTEWWAWLHDRESPARPHVLLLRGLVLPRQPTSDVINNTCDVIDTNSLRPGMAVGRFLSQLIQGVRDFSGIEKCPRPFFHGHRHDLAHHQ